MIASHAVQIDSDGQHDELTCLYFADQCQSPKKLGGWLSGLRCDLKPHTRHTRPGTADYHAVFVSATTRAFLEFNAKQQPAPEEGYQ
jgi:hypothetical protein